MTQFFAHMKSKESEMLKKLLWKIQDEFISMYYDGRENLEMRWFEGHILTAQEYLTTHVTDNGGRETARELRTIGWVEFQKKYSSDAGSPRLRDSFSEYEEHLQRIVYRRFKFHYDGKKWPKEDNPQDENKGEEDKINEDREKYSNVDVIIPDHRVRRLQHLLSDLVGVLDGFTATKLNRPVRRCKMSAEDGSISFTSNPPGSVTNSRVPCDCSQDECNPAQVDFEHRQLLADKGKRGLKRCAQKGTREEQKGPTLNRKDCVEQSKV